MANRNSPVSGNFSLSFLNGNLSLVDGNGTLAWSTNTTTSNGVDVKMALNADPKTYPGVGYLALYLGNESLWQSSDQPTDTLVIYQTLQPGMRLLSWASSSDPSEGPYSLVMEPGGLALYDHSFSDSLPYWIWSSYGTNDTLSVMRACNNSVMMSPDDALFFAKSSCNGSSGELRFSDYGVGDESTVRFLRVQPDGNLIANTLGATWSENFDALNGDSCRLPTYCGAYGVCSQNSQCDCPANSSGSFPLQNTQRQGCPPSRNLSGCHSDTLQPQKFLPLTGVDYFSNKYSPPLNLSTEQTCKDECFQNCSCLAAFWHVHTLSCFHVDKMGSLQGAMNSSYLAFLKVADIISGSNSSNNTSRVIAGVVSGLAALFTLSALAVFIYRRFLAHTDLEDEEPFLDSLPGLPTRYSYKDLSSVTNGFSEKLGHGGFGTVYAGTLQDGTRVAVKQLESLRQGSKEFRAEVATMGGIHHYNLVRLVGFCAQASHKLLVYEYMAKGSLDEWLFSGSRTEIPLEWQLRFNIALGAARGLMYLHEDCRDRIIHLDIKPQNILLDQDFVAKVSDFGLSRLMGRDETHVVTTMRGTPGYLAPEWLTQGAITEKSDVYSFGMLLMEIVSGRKNLDSSLDAERAYFPSWAFQVLATQEGSVAHLTNAEVDTPEKLIQATRVINTAFLCVLEDPDLRPSMGTVVQMLEGRVPVLDLQLSDLSHNLHFALRLSSPSAKTRAEEALGNIFTPNLEPSGGLMSFEISAR